MAPAQRELGNDDVRRPVVQTKWRRSYLYKTNGDDIDDMIRHDA